MFAPGWVEIHVPDLFWNRQTSLIQENIIIPNFVSHLQVFIGTINIKT